MQVADNSCGDRYELTNSCVCEQDGGDNGASTNPVILGMKAKITEQLEAVSVEIQDLSGGDNQHVAIDVVSEWFDGKNSLQRQRAVYKAIWEEMQVGHIRAFSRYRTQCVDARASALPALQLIVRVR